MILDLVLGSIAFFPMCFLHRSVYKLSSVSLLHSIDVLRNLGRIPLEKKISLGNSEEAEYFSFSTGFLICQRALYEFPRGVL